MRKLTLSQLSICQKIYTTSLSYLVIGEGVFIRDKDLFQDLKDESWFSLLMFSLTGRNFTDNQISLFQSIWALSFSYPDARIWNNRVAAISATAGSTVNLASAAGMVVSESRIFGSGLFSATYDLLLEIKHYLRTSNDLSAFLRQRFALQKKITLDSDEDHYSSVMPMPGYGRPFVNQDERITPLLEKAKSLGFGQSDYVKIAFDVEQALYELNCKTKMHVSILMSALCLEQGLTKAEFLAYASMCYLSGIVSVFHDVALKPKNSFFPFSANQITYMGKNKRSLRLNSAALNSLLG